MSQVPDPDDIFRAINEDIAENFAGEFNCLVPILWALKFHHTAACNVLTLKGKTTFFMIVGKKC